MATGRRAPRASGPGGAAAVARPPSMPGYQAIRIAGTWCRQASMMIALPPITTTTVRGLAAATMAISASSRRCSVRALRPPTLVESLTQGGELASDEPQHTRVEREPERVEAVGVRVGEEFAFVVPVQPG